jgi:hypothetical protein
MGALLAIALQETPAIIESLKGLFVQQHPDAPVPTDAEVIAAYQAALASSLAKDADWLAAHPTTDVNGNPIP